MQPYLPSTGGEYMDDDGHIAIGLLQIIPGYLFHEKSGIFSIRQLPQSCLCQSDVLPSDQHGHCTCAVPTV